MGILKLKNIIVVSLALLCACPAFALAESYDSVLTVVLSTPPTSPTISKSMEKGEVAEYDVRIRNSFDFAGKVGLYPLVYEVDPDGTFRYYDDQSLSRDSSLAKWVDFQRSVIELEQGQEAIHKLKIKPAPDAKEGSYQAVVMLSRGSTQFGAAEAATKYNEARITINLEIKAHVVEKAEVAEFKPVTPILTKSPLGFSLKIKNIGNRPVTPKGDVILYTKNGKELSSVAIEDKTIAPGTTAEYPVKVNFLGTPGRYKVKFLAEYGDGKKDMQDIIYVLYMPAVFLTIITILLLALLGYLAVLISKRRKGVEQERGHERREGRDYVINLKK